jgi:hypothetical protein
MLLLTTRTCQITEAKLKTMMKKEGILFKIIVQLMTRKVINAKRWNNVIDD